MSREASPEEPEDCVATKTAPSPRCSAGQASGRTVASVASALAPAGTASGRRVRRAVAAGRISRMATHSVSSRSPAKGRCA